MTTRAPLSSPAAGDGHGQLAGVSIERRAPASRAASSAGTVSTRPSSTRASSSAMRSGSITLRSPRSPRRVLAPEEADVIAALSARRLGARTGRAHPRAQGILGTAVQAQSPRPSCRGRRPRPWSRRRWRRSTRQSADRARCASPISAPARARCCWPCSRSCRTLTASAPISASPRCSAPATTPPRSAFQPVRRSWPATMAARSADRSISWCPIRPMSRGRTLPGCRPRCATSIRGARSTAGPTVSMDIALSHPQARRLLAPSGVLVLELGWGQLGAVAAIFAAAGLAPGGPRHDLSGIARALVVRCRP